MSTPLRFIPDESKRFLDRHGLPIAVVEITIRTLMGVYLLKPTPRNRNLILGVLGRAQERLDFELYGYAYLSNHGSLLVGVRDVVHLARIMEFIHSNIARELGRKELSLTLSAQNSYALGVISSVPSPIPVGRSSHSRT